MMKKLKRSQVISFVIALNFIGLQGASFEESSLRDDSSRSTRNRLNQELLPLFQQINIAERVQAYLIGGGDPNLANDAGLTLLHMAAYYGRQELVALLVNSHNANACNVDTSGFLAGDYVRMALIKGTLSNVSIRTLLNESETVNFERRVSINPFIEGFIRAFERKCDELDIATKVLNSGKVSRALNYLEPATILNFLGNILPLPGANIVARGAAVVADHLVEQQEQARRDQYIRNAPAELSREFKKLAYALSCRYEEPIQRLTEQGAKDFGTYCAEKTQEYLATEVIENAHNQSFTYHVLDYLGTLSPKEGLRRTMVPLQKGGAWRAKKILRGDPDIPNSKWPLRKIDVEIVVNPFDQEEIARLELLLARDVEMPAYIPQIQENLSEPNPPRSSKVDIKGTAYGKSRIIGINGELDGDTKVAIETRDDSKAINVSIGEIKMSDETSLSASKPASQSHKGDTKNTETEITAKAYDQSKVIMFNKGKIDNW